MDDETCPLVWIDEKDKDAARKIFDALNAGGRIAIRWEPLSPDEIASIARVEPFHIKVIDPPPPG